MKTFTSKCNKQFVFTIKTSFMQRIADLVRTGHTLYVQGSIPLEKAERLVAKFDERFQISISAMTASRARKAGGSTTRLLMHYKGEGDLVDWILLRTHGTVDQSEAWKDALSDHERVEVTGYQLFRRTRPVTSVEEGRIKMLIDASKDPGLPEHECQKVAAALAKIKQAQKNRLSWTWGYSRERYQGLRDSVQLAIRRKQMKVLDDLIFSLSRTPGFAGAREQVRKIWELVLGEWVRSISKTQPPPELPRVGYVRRVKDRGKLLRDLVRDYR